MDQINQLLASLSYNVFNSHNNICSNIYSNDRNINLIIVIAVVLAVLTIAWVVFFITRKQKNPKMITVMGGVLVLIWFVSIVVGSFMLILKKSYDDNYALFETCIAFPTSNACRDCVNNGQAGSLCGKCQSSFKNYCHSNKAPKADAYADDYSYVDQVQGNCE